MDSHQTPEPVDFLSRLADDTEASVAEAIFQFNSVKRMYVGMLSPRQQAI